MTLFEVSEWTAARDRGQHDFRVSLGWLTAALNRTKTIPKLDTLLAEKKAKSERPQTPEELRAKMLAAFGLRGKVDG